MQKKVIQKCKINPENNTIISKSEYDSRGNLIYYSGDTESKNSVIKDYDEYGNLIYYKDDTREYSYKYEDLIENDEVIGRRVTFTNQDGFKDITDEYYVSLPK